MIFNNFYVVVYWTPNENEHFITKKFSIFQPRQLMTINEYHLHRVENEVWLYSKYTAGLHHNHDDKLSYMYPRRVNFSGSLI